MRFKPFQIKAIDDVIKEYQSVLDKPKFIIIAHIETDYRPACTVDSVEFAHKIMDVIAKYGEAHLEKTEYHEDGQTFNLTAYIENTRMINAMVSGITTH